MVQLASDIRKYHLELLEFHRRVIDQDQLRHFRERHRISELFLVSVYRWFRSEELFPAFFLFPYLL